MRGAESTKSKNNVANSGSTPDHYSHLLLQPRYFGFDGTSAAGCASDGAEVNGSDETFLEDAGAKWTDGFRPFSSRQNLISGLIPQDQFVIFIQPIAGVRMLHTILKEYRKITAFVYNTCNFTVL